MSRHDFHIPVTFTHRVAFTRNVFHPSNPELAEILADGKGRRVLVFIEEAIHQSWPDLCNSIDRYLQSMTLDHRGTHIYPGGEHIKSSATIIERICQTIDQAHIDRHSYILAIGGGAFLDAIGYAAAISHRGIRLVRFPTTSLSQDDSGVGVKCAINAFGKKNWLGAFAVPFAVINDFDFLKTLPEQVTRDGLIEAVKVAAVKDVDFFQWLEANMEKLAALDPSTLTACIEKSALLHVQHIAYGGDPFETGSSRPLDFGHWAAHKLESLTNYQLPHAQAVAIGLALDALYSTKTGHAPESTAPRIMRIIDHLGMDLYHPALDWVDESGQRQIIAGIDEFREHLGGELTVLMLKNIGSGIDVHTIDASIVADCIKILRQTHLQKIQ